MEYLEFNKIQTRTKTGSDCSDVRTVPPKMFATDGTKEILSQPTFFWATKRPEESNEDDDPFYLAANNGLTIDSLATCKRRVQVRRCWRRKTQRFNEENGSEFRNWKRQASKSQRQKDNDPDLR